MRETHRVYLKTIQNTNSALSFGRYHTDWIDIQKYSTWSRMTLLMHR